MDFGRGSFGFAFRSGVWGDMDFVPTLRVDELDVITRSSVIEAGRLAMKKKIAWSRTLQPEDADLFGPLPKRDDGTNQGRRFGLVGTDSISSRMRFW